MAKENKTKIIKIDGENYEVTLLNSLKKSTTQRGFGLYTFKDRSDIKCSLQDSSLATEPAILFGVDDPNPQILIPGEGWKDYPIPEEVILSTRMQLTQEQVKALLPILKYFAETGEYIRDFKKK